jgi:hypothetical protein
LVMTQSEHLRLHNHIRWHGTSDEH